MPPREPIWTSWMPDLLPKKVCGGRRATCLWRIRSAKHNRPNRNKIMKKSLAAAGIVLALGMSTGANAQNTALRVGAAKVDVTPAPTELPKNYEGILDHIFSRAIVIDNGTASAALISVDAGGVPDPIWQAVSKQLEADLGILAKNVLLSATHS